MHADDVAAMGLVDIAWIVTSYHATQLSTRGFKDACR